MRHLPAWGAPDCVCQPQGQLGPQSCPFTWQSSRKEKSAFRVGVRSSAFLGRRGGSAAGPPVCSRPSLSSLLQPPSASDPGSPWGVRKARRVKEKIESLDQLHRLVRQEHHRASPQPVCTQPRARPWVVPPASLCCWGDGRKAMSLLAGPWPLHVGAAKHRRGRGVGGSSQALL